jgi:hypothetical protein
MGEKAKPPGFHKRLGGFAVSENADNVLGSLAMMVAIRRASSLLETVSPAPVRSDPPLQRMREGILESGPVPRLFARSF